MKKEFHSNMKKTKVYYNGKRLKDVYVGATRREVFKYRAVRFFRRLALLTMIFGSFWSAYQALQPDSIVYKVEAKEVVKEIQAPILDRIADCESGQREKWERCSRKC